MLERDLPGRRQQDFSELVRKASGITLIQDGNAGPEQQKQVVQVIDELITYVKSA